MGIRLYVRKPYLWHQKMGGTDPDGIRQCYYIISRKEFRPEPLKLQASAPRLGYDPNLAAYDSLAGGSLMPKQQIEQYVRT